MRLYYFKCPNFGDALNPWLWPQLLSGVLDDDDSSIFVGIGTLLNNKVPKQPFKVVFGSGAGYAKRPPIVDERWRIYCVRGPLSAKALDVDPRLAITDGAVLLRILDMPSEPKRYPISFIPHWYSASYWDWSSLCEQAGLHYIDPIDPVESIIREIRQSEMIIAEAMHGAIVADAFRVPWIPVRAYGHILNTKWVDWTQSLGLNYDPVYLPALHSAENLIARPRRVLRRLHLENHLVSQLMLGSIKYSIGHVVTVRNRSKVGESIRALKTAAAHAPILSSDQTITSVTARLEEQLEQLRNDYGVRRLDVPDSDRGLG